LRGTPPHNNTRSLFFLSCFFLLLFFYSTTHTQQVPERDRERDYGEDPLPLDNPIKQRERQREMHIYIKRRGKKNPSSFLQKTER
jgi:hypothetical protein